MNFANMGVNQLAPNKPELTAPSTEIKRLTVKLINILIL